MITTIVLAACLWTTPGADPYTGSAREAIERFAIPFTNREELISSIEQRHYNERLYIGRDQVWSTHAHFNNLMLMHFGQNKICWGVNRNNWSQGTVQPGELYCSEGYCVGRPDICGNLTQLFNYKPNSSSNVRPTEEVHTVPEPSSLALLLLPLAWLIGRRQR